MNKAVTIGLHRKLLSELAGDCACVACVCVCVWSWITLANWFHVWGQFFTGSGDWAWKASFPTHWWRVTRTQSFSFIYFFYFFLQDHLNCTQQALRAPSFGMISKSLRYPISKQLLHLLVKGGCWGLQTCDWMRRVVASFALNQWFNHFSLINNMYGCYSPTVVCDRGWCPNQRHGSFSEKFLHASYYY